jgi:5'-nucleotidase
MDDHLDGIDQDNIGYIDMDGVLCDYWTPVQRIMDNHLKNEGVILSHPEVHKMYPRVFLDFEPIEGAIEAYHELCTMYDMYILSTPAWVQPHAYRDKRLWVEAHLGKNSQKKLILSHNKGLMNGKFLIDDMTHNGVTRFKGKHIHFGQPGFENWQKTMEYFRTNKL